MEGLDCGDAEEVLFVSGNEKQECLIMKLYNRRSLQES